MSHDEIANRIVRDVNPRWSASDLSHAAFQRWIAGEIAAALRAERAQERFRACVLLRRQVEAARSREAKEQLREALKEVEEGKAYGDELPLA